jgi:hypothetical protein
MGLKVASISDALIEQRRDNATRLRWRILGALEYAKQTVHEN